MVVGHAELKWAYGGTAAGGQLSRQQIEQRQYTDVCVGNERAAAGVHPARGGGVGRILVAEADPALLLAKIADVPQPGWLGRLVVRLLVRRGEQERGGVVGVILGRWRRGRCREAQSLCRCVLDLVR